MLKLEHFKIFSGFGVLCFIFLCSSQTEAFIFQDRISVSKSIAHYAMGQIYDLLGLPNRAVMEFEKAAQFDEASYLIHLRLGADYARLDMLAKSEEELKIASKYNPDDLQSHYLLALIYSTQKEYEKAATEYEIILKSFSKVEPQNIEIYGYLGQLYYSQKKYDQAVKQFEKILELEPDNADVMYLLGSLYLEADERKGKIRAIELLKKSIEINPEHDGSLNTLGYLYAQEGEHFDEAMSLISRALKISPDNGAYLDSLGWVYYQKKKYRKALELFIRADKTLKDPVIYDHMGDTYHKLGEIDNAIKYWELSLELFPGQKEIINKINSLKNIQAKQVKE